MAAGKGETMGYTKGRWNLVDTPAIRDIFNGCSVIVSDQVDDAIIATIAEDVPEYKANGNLLASAPEVLEALKGLSADVEKVARDSYSTCDGNFDDDFRIEDPNGYAAWSAARAAIAKAEGRP